MRALDHAVGLIGANGPRESVTPTAEGPFGDQPALSVSVVVCAYTERRWEDLTSALRSLLSQTRPPHEVILVVDHCQPLLDRALPAFPEVTVVPNKRAAGLSGARNTGIEVASGDIVAFLDDDASAAPDCLERMMEAYRDPSVIGVGGMVRAAWVARRPAWLPPEFEWVVGCSYVGLPASTDRVRNLIGANMSFRRAVLVEVGGFSAALGRTGANAAGCEETELCIRAARSQAGAQLIYEPAAQVAHRVPPSRGTWRYFLKRCYAEGRSKAVVAHLVGRDQALSSERRYLRKTLPLGMVRSAGALAQGKWGTALRVPGLMLGVASTTLGYASGRSRSIAERSSASNLATFEPAAAMAPLPRRPAAVPEPPHHGGIAAATAPALPIVVALGLWASALLTPVHLDRMTDLGLISVLPATYWLGLAILTVGFGWTIQRPTSSRIVLGAYAVALIAMLHATPTLLYGTLRYAWAWKHVGIVAYTMEHGTVDRQANILSAYSAWPGFFSLNALLASAAGLKSSLSYAAWGPPFNELLFLIPIVLILRSFTDDQRLVWTGVWIFYVGDWVGQDYFSPQAFAYFLYLVILAVCLRWYRSSRRRPTRARDRGPDPSARRHRLSLYAMVTVMAAAIASTHQLTPFALVAGLGVLALVGRLSYRSLPVVVGVISVGWVLYSAVTFPFLHQNLYWILQSLGHPFSNGSSTFINLSKASSDQVLVANIDRLTSAGVWVLAGVGYWRHRRQESRPGYRDWTPALVLALAPASLVLGNNYGGEVDFRIYFFALPFVALYGAAAFFPAKDAGRSIWTTLAVVVVGAAILAGFVFGNYGKERTNYFPTKEVSAMERLYDTAPPGSLLLGPSSNLPWAFDHYDAYQYLWYIAYPPGLAQEVIAHPVSTLVKEMAPYRHAYLIFSDSQSADIEMTGSIPVKAERHIEAAVLASNRFTVVTRNRDITILTLAMAHAHSSATVAGSRSGQHAASSPTTPLQAGGR